MDNINQILKNNIITMKNTINTRTIGGFKNKDNLYMKNGILFRSDNLSKLSKYDINTLNILGIKTIIDFRSDYEKQREPNILPNNIKYIEYPIEVDKTINDNINDILSGKINKNIESFLINANKDFINKYSHIYSKFIKDIINNKLENILFHCTAGKDRTGFASALILSILEIPREIILKEYLFSNYCIDKTINIQLEKVSKIMGIEKDKHKILPLLRVKLEYIQSAFDVIDLKYGNITNYIKNGLLISNDEIIKLKKMLLINKL